MRYQKSPNFIETESKILIARVEGKGETRSSYLTGIEFSFDKTKKFGRPVSQQREYT